MQEARLLILGGTGNVGQHVVAWLQRNAAAVHEFHAGAAGDEDAAATGEGQGGRVVRLLVGTRNPTALALPEANLAEGKVDHEGIEVVVEPVACDLDNPASIRAAVHEARPHRAFLCLPQALGPPAMAAASEACAAACAAAGVARLVRVASYGIDATGVAQGALGAAHVAAEEHVKGLGELCLSSVRPTSFHTNFVKYDVASIAAEGVFRSPLGAEARVNWVHTRDIGHVAAALLARADPPERGHEVVEVTGPAESTLSAPAMAALLTAELGRSIVYEEVAAPPVAEYQALWTFLRAGGFDAATDSVHRLTGQPPTDFASIVREHKLLLAPSS